MLGHFFQISQHPQVLPAEFRDGKINFKVVAVKLNRGQVPIKEIQQLVVFSKELPAEFEPPGIILKPMTAEKKVVVRRHRRQRQGFYVRREGADSV